MLGAGSRRAACSANGVRCARTGAASQTTRRADACRPRSRASRRPRGAPPATRPRHGKAVACGAPKCVPMRADLGGCSLHGSPTVVQSLKVNGAAAQSHARCCTRSCTRASAHACPRWHEVRRVQTTSATQSRGPAAAEARWRRRGAQAVTGCPARSAGPASTVRAPFDGAAVDKGELRSRLARPSIEGSRPAAPTAAFALWPLLACGSRSTATHRGTAKKNACVGAQALFSGGTYGPQPGKDSARDGLRDRIGLGDQRLGHADAGDVDQTAVE